MIRDLELSVSPSPQPPRRGEGWKLNQLPVANDLINAAYVMKPVEEYQGAPQLVIAWRFG